MCPECADPTMHASAGGAGRTDHGLFRQDDCVEGAAHRPRPHRLPVGAGQAKQQHRDNAGDVADHHHGLQEGRGRQGARVCLCRCVARWW